MKMKLDPRTGKVMPVKITKLADEIEPLSPVVDESEKSVELDFDYIVEQVSLRVEEDILKMKKDILKKLEEILDKFPKPKTRSYKKR